MAAAFLGIGSAATAAPLNPTYRAEEFEFYLTDLNAKLLVVAQGKDTKFKITPTNVPKFLGVHKFRSGRPEEKDEMKGPLSP